MLKSAAAASPEEYVKALSGWKRDRVETLRHLVRSSFDFSELVKWGHLVYLTNGPALLIRAEESRVLLGFWRGHRLISIESRLKPGGKYEMASLELLEATAFEPETVVQLARKAALLNERLGDPTKVARH